jgi:hypothetical protein
LCVPRFVGFGSQNCMRTCARCNSAARDPRRLEEPCNAADAARQYCERRFCVKVPAEGIESRNCLKKHVKRLPPARREAVQAL